MIHTKKYLQFLFFQQGKTASLVTSKLCCSILYSLWVLNKNATSAEFFNWLWNSLVSLSYRPHYTSYKWLSLQPQKQLKITVRAPEWSSCDATHHPHSPFNMHWPPCREFFSCCLYSHEGCTKPRSFIVRKFLTSHLFVASFHAYVPLPALFCNVQSSRSPWCWLLWCIYRHRRVLSHPSAGLSKLSYSGHLT